MSSIVIEELQKQLAVTQQELETAIAHVHRCDGAIQVLKHLIKGAEAPLEDSKNDTDN